MHVSVFTQCMHKFMYLCMYVYVCINYVHTYVRTYLGTYLPNQTIHLPNYLPNNFTTYVPTDLHLPITYLSTCRPIHLPTYLSSYRPIHKVAHAFTSRPIIRYTSQLKQIRKKTINHNTYSPSNRCQHTKI